MDERLRNLERRSLNGDRIALQQYRILALKLDLVPQEIIPALAGLGYQPAREMISHREWPTRGQSFYQLFHNIPQNAENAACIAYRVIAPAVQRVLDTEHLEELLNHCIPSDIRQDDIFLQNHNLMQILRSASDLITQMADCEYLEDLMIRSMRAHNSNNEPWNRGWQYSNSLVMEHYQVSQRVEQIAHIIQACATTPESWSQSPESLRDYTSLARALFAIADSVSPPVGFISQRQLVDNIFRLRYFLDGMDNTWVDQTYIEAIFSFYLI